MTEILLLSHSLPTDSDEAQRHEAMVVPENLGNIHDAIWSASEQKADKRHECMKFLCAFVQAISNNEQAALDVRTRNLHAHVH